MVNRILKMHKTLGVVFLALVVLSVYLTYAVFTKKFSSYDRVTLETSSIGLQLPKRADVKIRGVIVGEVLDYSSSDAGAKVTLGIYPDKLDLIPENVTGSILPKTLFGEKYVSLVVPDDNPAPQHLRAGDVITHTRVSTEVEKVLSDLLPLLRAVDPADLNTTLNALVTALQGRGDKLGQSLETVDAYLKRMNPQLPALVDDLALTSKVSDIYTDVLPQVADILDNSIVTGKTIEGREGKLKDLFLNVAGFADTLRTFLADNEENLVEAGEISTKMLNVLARYSPEFPCLTEGIVNAGKPQGEAFRGFQLHIVLETLPRQPRGYTAADVPRVAENRGPNCLHLPNPPWNQKNPVRRIPDFNDGVDSPLGKGTQRVAPDYRVTGGDGFAGSAAENSLYRELLAPSVGQDADQVGDLGPLLVGPMARGAEVQLR